MIFFPSPFPLVFCFFIWSDIDNIEVTMQKQWLYENVYLFHSDHGLRSLQRGVRNIKPFSKKNFLYYIMMSIVL